MDTKKSTGDPLLLTLESKLLKTLIKEIYIIPPLYSFEPLEQV